jgi:Big-like domain-containing protein
MGVQISGSTGLYVGEEEALSLNAHRTSPDDLRPLTGTYRLLLDGAEVAAWEWTSQTQPFVAEFRMVMRTAGGHVFTATYSGNDTWAPGSSQPMTVDVLRYPSQAEITSSEGGSSLSCPPPSPGRPSQPMSECAPSSTSGDPVTFRVLVHALLHLHPPAGYAPGGMAAFFVDGKPVGTARVVSGEAALTLPYLVAGNHVIQATYDGDGAFEPGISGAMPFYSSPIRLDGYWMVGARGEVYAFGGAPILGAAGIPPGTRAVDLEADPTGAAYWIVDDHGHVQTFGSAPHLGDAPASALGKGETVTSLSATPAGGGYWMFTSAGRALPFGNAVSYGDMAGRRLNGPVLDSIVTRSGKGYYMVASDGGIFSFGDATFRGSMGAARLNTPVQSLVPDPDGAGYWLVASDGGIFAFDAGFRGSMGAVRLNKPVTGMIEFAGGYLMVAEDGGIFNFSDRPFYGSLGDDPPPTPIVAVARFAKPKR